MSKRAKILVIEDDLQLAEDLCGWLCSETYEVISKASAEESLVLMLEQPFDLIVLDIGLPGMTGFELCRHYRGRGGESRILILSGAAGIDEKIEGLKAGADDYMAKPFDGRELSLRVAALLRRSLEFTDELLQFEDIELNLRSHQVVRSGEALRLVPQEYALLEFLMRSPNRVFRADELLRSVWNGGGSIDTVRTHVKTLRKKLEKNSQRPVIRTIQGVGYSLTVDW